MTVMFVGVCSPKALFQFFGSSLQVPDRWQELVSKAIPTKSIKYVKRMKATKLYWILGEEHPVEKDLGIIPERCFIIGQRFNVGAGGSTSNQSRRDG